MKRVFLFAILLAVCSLASAQTGIKTVVKVVEHRYSAHHHGVPGLWLAKPFMFGSGIGGLKIAEFKSLRMPTGDAFELREEVQRALGPEWFPFIETWSQSEGEWSVIYARPSAESMQLLIVTSENDDGMTVLQMNVSGKARKEWFDEPAACASRNKKIRSADPDEDSKQRQTETAKQ